MEGEVKEVKLYGSILSGYCNMVHHALRLKGVTYEYVEEDLKNKSHSLLEFNPVHKKVPVLVVDGKPIAESLIILQYIDEMWKDPPLLPEDPHQRAKLRFWADFIYQKLVPCTYAIRNSEGEAQKKAAEEFVQHMRTLEDGIKKELYAGGTFVTGEQSGLLDIILGPIGPGIKYLEDLAGVKLLEKEKLPFLCSCMEAYNELDVVKQTSLALSQNIQPSSTA